MHAICSTQGFVNSAEQGSNGSPGTAIFAFDVSPSRLRQECIKVFGPGIPPLRVPTIAERTWTGLHDKGGVVFTNGGLDEWAGGEYSRVGDWDMNDGVGEDVCACVRASELWVTD